MTVITPPVSRFFDFRLGLGIPLALMALLLMFDPSGLDFALAHLFYEPGQGFIGRQSFWLEDILHDRAKQAVILFGVLAILGFGSSLLFRRWHAWRRPLGFVVLALGLSTSIVTPLKSLTAVHCPWSLSEFGGSETFTPLLSPRAPTENPGRCWPGGHASSGFSLLALFFALRDRRPRAARLALVLALGLGAVLSLGRMMQGAHFLSHNLWTLLFDWLICLLCYRGLLYRMPAPQPVRPLEAELLGGAADA
ncbi:MAG: phosphatase PAP2 family protein [Pseudomonas sp.]|uniref:phosphatase PAP2 family protein n=1 Tax=Pseudomonas sp. TaxID=306 RepID=UPI0027201A1C|nr:phosphatase PAP2 family protein [Pseudomonas sp.]MDO9620136.1 phosphatase PAP2 family protein [Pseudomonas sp.]MDP2447267.1 phosphatase PAP2 family protein [Pseudomonas sp.]MDZ4337926.1 phosphatase PAP2 family protein [Pseudomonas sp.]